MHKVLFLWLSILSFWIISIAQHRADCKTYMPIGYESIALCSLNIDRVIIGDCEYANRTGNQSKVIVAVFLSWKDPIPGEKIQLTLKGITKLFDPFQKGCPPFVQFILDPDGMNYTVDALFTNGSCQANPVNIQLPLPCDPPKCLGPVAIGGKVFSDFNNNGLQESSESGIPDIEVRLYDDSKQLHATSKTKINGLWAIDNLTAGQKLRVEFQIPAGLYDSNPGVENKTRTQISAVGNCKVDLGIYQLRTLIDPDPWMALTLFTKGDAQKPTSPSYNEPTLVMNTYNTTQGGPRLGPNGNFYVASAGETGSIWGLCFQPDSRMLLSGAFLKRNASLGPGGLGAIYLTDLNSFLPNPPPQPNFRYYGNTSMMLNLDNFGINTGDETTLFRNLPLSPFDASHDTVSFDKIGKWGLGALELNEKGDTLFVVNLFNRSLITIAIGNPIQLPVTANRISEISIPDPGCSSQDDWRPWGLKYKDGTLYIGGVCSAESTNNRDDLHATVYSFANGMYKKTLSFELNYTKGFLEGNFCNTFRPWNRDFYFYYIRNDVTCGPVPVLSDIEFDSEGNMIVSIGDRYGYQTGGRDYGTNINDNLRYLTFAGGDNLKFYKLKNEYLLEQNATSGFYTTRGMNNNQGVCMGEFYFQDGFFSHQESALGALASHPSYNTVVVTLMDPANIWSNGWSQLNNSSGIKQVNYNLFTGENGTYGKSAGVGDIELLIGSSTLNGIGVSIGNYIWNDIDQDGVQDPGEIPLENVPVLLFDLNQTLIAQTKSDPSGLYYFKNLNPFSEYVIQIGADSNYVNGNLLINNVSYNTTTFQSKINFGNSENDSDASRSLPLPFFYQYKVALNYLTGKDGENNFSIDFGLVKCEQLTPDTVHFDLCFTDSINVGDKWFSVNYRSGIVKFANIRGFGCDSLLLVNTTIHSPSNYTIDTTICDGTEIIIHNQTFDRNKLSGLILLPGINQHGCDSIIQVNVNLLNPSESNVNFSICPAGKIILHNQTFDATRPSGRIILPNSNHLGCDSALNVQLQILPYTTSSLDTSICPNSYVIIHNQRFDELNRSGQIVLPGANTFGCDSIIEVNIKFLSNSSYTMDTSICPGSYVIIHNQRFDELNRSGQIILSGANTFGCDSIIAVNIKFLSYTRYTLDTSICPGSYVIIHNQRFDELNRSGQVILPGANTFGCDSIIAVNLKVKLNTEFRMDTAICPGGSVQLFQQTFDENKKSGKIILNSTNQFGCDSIINVNLSIRPEYLFIDTVESCVYYTWPVTGKNYSQSGVFRFDTITKDGCDSSFQMQLIIHPAYQFADTLCALEKYYWPANNLQLNQSGSYSFNHYSSDGCDSMEYLVLMIVYEGDVYLPNVFSPNGDHINDLFFVNANADVHSLDLFAIYDRWGELMFKQVNIPPNDPQYGWDGIFRNKPLDPAVFVYLVEWRDKFGGRHKAIGDVTLLR